MDSLMVRELARELDEHWRGERVDGLWLDRERRLVTLIVHGYAVGIDLAARGTRVFAASPPPRSPLLRGWTVREVRAPVDDRRLQIAFTRPGRFKGSPDRRALLIVSLVPAAASAVLRDEGGAVLGTVGGALPPPITPRRVLSDEEVTAASRAADPDALRDGRWMSPDVARWITSDPARAVERHRLVQENAPTGAWRCGGVVVPLPFTADAQAVASLIETPATEGRAPDAEPDARAERARARMEEELARASAAPSVRAIAAALMPLGDAPAPDVILLDGGVVAPVPHQPGESAAEAARRLHVAARRMERALATLPARLEALRLGGVSSGAPQSQPRGKKVAQRARLPYRCYRSSGGLDIWVGRGASANDALTFHAAAPHDVWMHARDAAGAHVVLRWQRDESPPSRDLEEAAALAAWHSKARGSTIVPVDWTRRKHVRRPRGGAPGLVVVERAKTIFARPSAALERRLRA